MAIEVLDGGSDWCRDAWENLEWKGLTTVDMGLIVLQAAQNLLMPFNLNTKRLYENRENKKAKFFRLSHDVVTCDVDRDVSTAYC